MSWDTGHPKAAAAVVMAFVVALGACSDDDGEAGGSPGRAVGDQASESATDPPTSDTTSPAEALRVVEQGFSTFPHPEAERPAVSIGAVVENTGDVDFDAVVVNFHMYDASGAELEDDLGAPDLRGVTIMHLDAGEVIGVGDTFDPFPGQPEVDRVEVRVNEYPYVPSVDDDWPEGTVIVTGSEAAGDSSCPGTDIAVRSTYQAQLPQARAFVVYRDGSGRIVGGAQGEEVAVPAGGEARMQVTPATVLGCPPGGVPGVAATDAYVDEGPEPADG